MERIYLDNSATTAVVPEVAKKMAETMEKTWGNPSSVHTIGQEAKQMLDQARSEVADFFGAKPEEIIFTSGGSESDNLAIRGVVESRTWNVERGLPHIITSATEHHAVLHTIEDLEKADLIEATYVKPDKDGYISPESIEKEIKDNTILVSIIYVNNETGAVAPIKEIGAMIEKQNTEYRIQNTEKILFHTDAVQAIEFMPADVNELGVDLLTFTAHKIHGPKGVGGLYVKKGVKLAQQITGGSQEFNFRAGTENIAGVVGLVEALKLVRQYSSSEQSESRSSDSSRSANRRTRTIKSVEKLRDKLILGIQNNVFDTILNAGGAKRAPHIANISFMNAEGEAIILNLDFLGIAVSSGSACTSRSLEPSHVLSAMGIPPEKTHGAIRFSLSRYTTEKEIDKVIEVLPPIIEKLRKMSPMKNLHV